MFSWNAPKKNDHHTRADRSHKQIETEVNIFNSIGLNKKKDYKIAHVFYWLCVTVQMLSAEKSNIAQLIYDRNDCIFY